MDVFVLPSLTEGLQFHYWSNACGVPVIASAVGASAGDQHGERMLVSPGSEDEISNAVLTLFRDPEARQKLAQSALVLVKTPTTSNNGWS